MDVEPLFGGRALERIFPPWPAPGPDEEWTTGHDGEFEPLPPSVRPPTWRDLSPRWIESAAPDLPLVDDDALLFYLPALLDHVARGRDSGVASDALAAALAWDDVDAALGGLTLLQIREIVAFLSGRASRARSREVRSAAEATLARWRAIERATARRVKLLWIASVVLIPASGALAILGEHWPFWSGKVVHHVLLAIGISLGIASYLRRSGSRPVMLREVPGHAFAFLGAGAALVIGAVFHYADPDQFGLGWLGICAAAAVLLAWLGRWRLRRARERARIERGWESSGPSP